ncbi:MULTISPECIES: hypothetical protein [Bacteroides]|uniref:hypothetical protein n=1 Tax=Bacteroides TaxID=816 RepID=UPI00189778EA|nr:MULTISPECIES: hypothetical protein [Bacteroides]MDC2748076.1 hypothetical protein [Bacteroides ovatus]MDC2758280.1 hypothetical protein [Bacteroides ovatus]
MSADVISCKAQSSFSPIERETSLLISAREPIDKSNLIPELVNSPLTASKLIRSFFLKRKTKKTFTTAGFPSKEQKRRNANETL